MQNFGSKDKPIEDEAASIKTVLDAFVAGDGNFVDTADVYHGGRSEEVVGRWLEGRRREDIVLATKARRSAAMAPGSPGLRRVRAPGRASSHTLGKCRVLGISLIGFCLCGSLAWFALCLQ